MRGRVVHVSSNWQVGYAAVLCELRIRPPKMRIIEIAQGFVRNICYLLTRIPGGNYMDISAILSSTIFVFIQNSFLFIYSAYQQGHCFP